MGLRQIEQGFSPFLCLIFGIFDDFSKWSIRLEEVLRNFVKSSKYAKKLVKIKKKPYTTCLLNPFFG